MRVYEKDLENDSEYKLWTVYDTKEEKTLSMFTDKKEAFKFCRDENFELGRFFISFEYVTKKDNLIKFEERQ